MPMPIARLFRSPALSLAAALMAGTLCLGPAMAQTGAATEIENLPDRVLFVVSGGYWAASAGGDIGSVAPAADGTDAAAAGKPTSEAAPAVDAAPATGAAPAADQAPAADAAKSADVVIAAPDTASEPTSRGYYRIVAIRAEDNHSLFYMQQMELTAEGPKVMLTMDIPELSDLNGYVTDLRPEDSSGASSQPGFAAYVYLKPDLETAEPDTWSVYIDDLGDMQVSRADN